MKTAIVIGATGLVGSALVDQLANSEGIGKVLTLTRRPFAHESAKVLNEVVDFDCLDQYEALFQGDMLFSCLGTTRQQAGSIAAQRKVDLDYQLKVAELAAGQGVQHYLLVSSSGANYLSPNPYLKMKGALERAVKNLGFPRVSIFQPSLLLGERSQFRLGESLGSVVMPALCRLPGLKRYRPIEGKQVALKMVQVSQASGGPLEVFKLDEIFAT